MRYTMLETKNARRVTSDNDVFAGLEDGPKGELPLMRDVRVGITEAIMVADGTGVTIIVLDNDNVFLTQWWMQCTYWQAVFFIEHTDNTLVQEELDALSFVKTH